MGWFFFDIFDSLSHSGKCLPSENGFLIWEHISRTLPTPRRSRHTNTRYIITPVRTSFSSSPRMCLFNTYYYYIQAYTVLYNGFICAVYRVKDGGFSSDSNGSMKNNVQMLLFSVQTWPGVLSLFSKYLLT